MRIPSGTTDQYIYFVAVDSTDLKTRETGLTTFTVYRSRNGAAAAAMTTPTVNETDATNMPGVYELLLDEDTTLAAGNDTEEICFHITQASMAPVTRTIELYRPETTVGNTLGVASDGDVSGNVDGSVASVATGGITASSFAASAITSTVLANSAITESKFLTGAITAAVLDSDVITASKIATDAITAAKIATDAITSTKLAASVGTEIGQAVLETDVPTYVAGTNAAYYLNSNLTQALSNYNNIPGNVWDELRASHVDSGSFGQGVASVQGAVTGNVNGSVGSVTGAVGSVTGAVGSVTGSVGSVTADVSADVTKVAGNTAGSTAMDSFFNAAAKPGTCTSASNSTITLAVGSSSVDDYYVGQTVICTNTGALGQSRVITAYNGTSRVATVHRDWATNPTASSTEYLIVPFATQDVSSLATQASVDTVDSNVDAILTDTGTTIPGTLATLATQASVDTVDGNVDAILVDTGTTLPGTLATLATQASVDTVDGNVDAILVDTGTTLPGLINTVDGNVDAILVDTGTTIPGTLATLATQASVDTVDGNVDAILVDTGTTLPASIATVDGNVDSILTDTGTTLPATLATLATQASVDTVDGNVDAILVDTGTTLPGTLATLATQASVDTVDSNVDAILVDTGTTLPASIATVDGNVDAILVDTGTTIPGLIATVDGNVDAILVDTGTTLPASIATVDGNVDSILTDTGTTLPATLATLATQASVDTVDGNVDAILVDTGTTIPGTLATLATQASVDTVDTNVDAILVDTGTTLPGTLATLATQASVDTVDANVDLVLEDTGTTIPATLTTINARASFLETRQKMGIESGTAGGGSTTTIELPVGLGNENTDGFYEGCYVRCTGGTGEGQFGRVTDYDSGTKVATLDQTFGTGFDNTSEFEMISPGGWIAPEEAKVIANYVWETDCERRWNTNGYEFPVIGRQSGDSFWNTSTNDSQGTGSIAWNVFGGNLGRHANTNWVFSNVLAAIMKSLGNIDVPDATYTGTNNTGAAWGAADGSNFFDLKVTHGTSIYEDDLSLSWRIPDALSTSNRHMEASLESVLDVTDTVDTFQHFYNNAVLKTSVVAGTISETQFPINDYPGAYTGADGLKDSAVVFITGTNKYQVRRVTTDSGVGQLVFATGFTDVPAEGDELLIIGRIE